MPDPVFNAVTGHLKLEREIGGYEAADRREAELADFYAVFAELLRVNPGEIAYVENATRAWDMAFYSLGLREGDRIITHAAEYASSYLAFLQLERRYGIGIDIAPSDSTGQIDVATLPSLVTPDTRAINLVHVPTQGGLVNPAAEVGAFAREHELIYILDACQSVGQLDVNIAEIGCHFLSGTGRKYLRGPRGTGFLYVADEILPQLEPPFIDLRAANWISEHDFEYAPGARRFENWESFIAGRLGLAVAARYALTIGLPNIEKRIFDLAGYLRAALNNIDGITVADQGLRQCGIVTFETQRERPLQLARRLRESNVNISVTEQSSARLDLERRQLSSLARASVHYFNTRSEIDTFVALLPG